MIPEPRQIDKWQIVILALIIIQACIFMLLGLWRHWGYMTSIYDLGCFDQAVWRAANGQSLINTSVFSQPVKWLGFHFHPVLYLFVPLYKILPSVNWLILAQSIALPLSAWPIFLIAQHVTRLKNVAFMWTIAYMCNPFLLNAAAWDFHPVSLAVPFFALSFLAIERDQPFLLLLSTVFIICCKEHFGLAVAGLGLLYGVRHRNWVVSISFVLAGILSFMFIVQVVMPSFSPSGQLIMLSDGMDQLSRYGWLGDSLQAVLKKVFSEPLVVARTVLFDMKGFGYLTLLFITFLFLPFASPFWLLPACGDLLANLLSVNPMPRSIFSYHSVTIIPVLAVAAIHGSNRCIRYLKRYSSNELAIFVLLINLGIGYCFAPFPLPGAVNFWRASSPMSSYDHKKNEVEAIIGNSSVSVQANIGPHFSQRTLIYSYPQKVGEVDYIVLRLNSPTRLLLPRKKDVVGTLAQHLQMDTVEYLDSVEALLRDERYGVVLWDNPWLVFQRGKPSGGWEEQILLEVFRLHNTWVGNELN